MRGRRLCFLGGMAPRRGAFVLRRSGRVNGKHLMVGRKTLGEIRKTSDGTRPTIGWFVAKHRDGVWGQSGLIELSIGVAVGSGPID